MKYGFIKAACFSPEITVADPEKNLEAILTAYEKAESEGVRLLLFSEMCLTGCTAGDLIRQKTLQNAVLSALSKLLERTEKSDMVLAVGAPVSVAGTIYKCTCVLQKGRILGIVPAAAAPFSPSRTIGLLGQAVPFGSTLVFACENMPALRFGISAGDLLSNTQDGFYTAAKRGCSLILAPNAGVETVSSAKKRRDFARFISEKCRCALMIASASPTESTTNFVCGGHDLIVESGLPLSESLPFGEGFACTEIDFERIENERELSGFHAMPDDAVPFTLAERETVLTRTVKRFPFLADTDEEQAERTDEILNIQAYGLKKRMEHTHTQKAVIGVSGGLDSTLALIVCKRAMDLMGKPASDILAVTMPCFGTSKKTKGNAGRLCEALGIKMRTIEITRSVKSHLNDLGHPLDVTDTAYENAQARERTQVLMDLCNMENGLVIGTGDLSELSLGFATYNGDHMSMYAVNAGISKTLMRNMLMHIAKEGSPKLARVLTDIVETPVSPELLPGKDGEIAQITEDIIGPYELHDFFLYHLVRLNESREKILYLAKNAFAGLYTEETISKWLDVFLKRFIAQQFKRSCMPDGPKIGSVSLSPRGDWDMPSDASSAIFFR